MFIIELFYLKLKIQILDLLLLEKFLIILYLFFQEKLEIMWMFLIMLKR
jgi:hypothetical protein